MVFGMHIGNGYYRESASLVVLDAALVLPGLILLVVFYVLKRTINLRTLSAAILLCLLAAMLPWGFGGDLLQQARVLMVYAMFTLFDLSVVASLVEIGKMSKIPCPVVVLLGRLLIMVSVTFGVAIMLIFDLDRIEPVITAVTSAMVLLLVAAYAWFASGKQVLRSKAPADKAPFKMAVAAIAEEKGLSKREGEVLQLVARGYNAKSIESELFISGNTVKSHLYHIYAKLGVHTQQDAIKMVETKAKKYRELM
ncbi:MAG: helix-turn-helix transcriptional regulator, partial [Eggerthellaceae bacterium]|nr:helix-turn-helix transcriptional regulator [Eggerthellaceae bacterium]